eukprot:CAMPEP_0175226038 /NCGR_PEP_ID=MMETSP0093-20121207/22690_1 /TAXON_ID=311494 /ORGANISM="Alexandrium monilatum, Strain CCMP3105" /LENGTH=159 /DNA_ID=CAMNT_0016519757 /DNA_START=73 /DNA_END=552 /DNA_ORIENTATION=-
MPGWGPDSALDAVSVQARTHACVVCVGGPQLAGLPTLPLTRAALGAPCRAEHPHTRPGTCGSANQGLAAIAFPRARLGRKHFPRLDPPEDQIKTPDLFTSAVAFLLRPSRAFTASFFFIPQAVARASARAPFVMTGLFFAFTILGAIPHAGWAYLRLDV